MKKKKKIREVKMEFQISDYENTCVSISASVHNFRILVVKINFRFRITPDRGTRKIEKKGADDEDMEMI